MGLLSQSNVGRTVSFGLSILTICFAIAIIVGPFLDGSGIKESVFDEYILTASGEKDNLTLYKFLAVSIMASSVIAFLGTTYVACVPDGKIARGVTAFLHFLCAGFCLGFFIGAFNDFDWVIDINTKKKVSLGAAVNCSIPAAVCAIGACITIGFVDIILRWCSGRRESSTKASVTTASDPERDEAPLVI